MIQPKILLVEDDKNISKLIKYNLEKAEFGCALAFSGEEALAILEKTPADLVILDIMLPQIDGLEVCRLLKQNLRLKYIPIIMLTAKGEEVDRIVGLELGADDYITKPFSPRELVLRIKAILKRGKGLEEESKEVVVIGKIGVDIPKHKVTVANKEITLTPMEFKLLLNLMERQGRVQTRENLLNSVWGFSGSVETRTLDTHVKRLREKLGKGGKAIETVRGLGYRFREEG